MSARRTLRAILANTDSNRIQTGQFCTNAPGVSIGLQRRCEPAVINDLSRNAASGRNTSLINLSACRKKTRDYFAEAQLAHIHRLPVRYPPHAVLEWIKMPERRSKRDQRRIEDPPILGRRFLDSGDGLAPKTSVTSIPSVLSIPSVPCCSTIRQRHYKHKSEMQHHQARRHAPPPRHSLDSFNLVAPPSAQRRTNATSAASSTTPSFGTTCPRSCCTTTGSSKQRINPFV